MSLLEKAQNSKGNKKIQKHISQLDEQELFELVEAYLQGKITHTQVAVAIGLTTLSTNSVYSFVCQYLKIKTVDNKIKLTQINHLSIEGGIIPTGKRKEIVVE